MKAILRELITVVSIVGGIASFLSGNAIVILIAAIASNWIIEAVKGW